jgi:hypothetical protein
MTRHFTNAVKSTTVRLIGATTAALLVTGCGMLAPLGSQTQPCPTAGPALCEHFGPQSRCNCADKSVITRELDRFNRSAQLGLRGW